MRDIHGGVGALGAADANLDRNDIDYVGGLSMKGAKLPPGWAEVPLGDLLSNIEAGVSVNSEDRQCSSGEVGVMKTSCVGSGRFFPDQHKAVISSDRGRVASTVRGGCIIVSRMNTPSLVGESGYVDEDYPNLFLPDRLWQLQPKCDVEGRWLAQVLASPGMRMRLQSLATGTSGSMKNISQDSLLGLGVVVPPSSVQARIAALLAAWDRAIAVTNATVVAKRLRKRAAMEKLLLRGDEVVRLGEVFVERDERGLEFPLAGITAAEGVVPRDAIDRRDTSSEDKSNYKVIRPGDIGYNTMRMWQGVSGLSRLTGLISPAYTVVTAIDGRIDPSYAAHLFKLPRMINKFLRYSQGLVDDTLQLKFAHFAEIEIVLPGAAEQRRVASFLDEHNTEIDLLARKLELLQHQKRGLMQKLFVGNVVLIAPDVEAA